LRNSFTSADVAANPTGGGASPLASDVSTLRQIQTSIGLGDINPLVLGAAVALVIWMVVK
jgi:hypothetical protein